MKKKKDLEHPEMFHRGTKGATPGAMTADDDILPEYDLEGRKAQPNRFARRSKIVVGAGRGGAREGAGRKRAPEPLERHTITLLKSDAEYLRSLDLKLSAAIHKLIRANR